MAVPILTTSQATTTRLVKTRAVGRANRQDANWVQPYQRHPDNNRTY